MEMSESKFVHYNNSIRFIHGENKEFFRIAGEWVQKAGIKEIGAESNYLPTFKLLRILPGWPLVDGINMNKNSGGFIPDSHQFLPMDILEAGWLSGFGVRDGNGLRRSRILISDEGGTGKTLSASLAVRYISLIKPIDGPIICLVPPLLIDHWVKHLRAVFHDEPERVEGLSSASHFGEHHRNRIIVVSKWSWAKHFAKISEDIIHPLCVVIDEVHQGRTGKINDDDIEGDEKFTGMAGLHKDTKQLSETDAKRESDNLRTAIKKTCRKSAYVIGVSATPINLQLSELNTILSDMNAEGYEDASLYENTSDYSKNIGELMLKTRNMNGNTTKLDFFKPLINIFPERIWELHGIEKSDIDMIKEWCSSSELLTAPEALRALRELHPYGRNLSIILREYLSGKHIKNFRTRETIVLKVEKGDTKLIWDNIVETKDDGIESPVLHNRLDRLKQSALILNSHRTGLWRRNHESKEKKKEYYKGQFDTKDGISRGEIESIKDPRVVELLKRFNKEIEDADEDGNDLREERIGAVIFSEWNGTIALEGLNKDIREISKNYPGKVFTVLTLKGGQGISSLEDTMKICRRQSIKRNCFPILITSPAGEVGIEMAWASNLVHWDLHTNPQRMEQRTWRVDRRMEEGERIKPQYKVFFPMYEDSPINDLLEKKIQPRWEAACNELGKEISTYLADSTHVVEGMPHSIELWGSEIKKFKKLVSEMSGSANDNYIQLRHRWKAFTGLTTVGFDAETSNVIDDGVFQLNWPESGMISFNDCKMSLIRDLELLSRSLSDSLAMHYSERGNVPISVHMSEAGSDSRAMPLLDKLITKISPRLDKCVYSYKKSNDIKALAINIDILELHEKESIDETGLLFKINDEWKQWCQFDDTAKEKYGQQLLNILEQCWKGSIKQSSTDISVPNSQKHPSLDNRILVLKQFREEQEIKISRHNQRLENEECTDDEKELRKDAVKICKDTIKKCGKKIDFLIKKSKLDYRILLFRE